MWMFALLCVSIAFGVICFLMVLDIKRNRYVQMVSKTNSNTELGSSAHRKCVLSLGFTCKHLLDKPARFHHVNKSNQDSNKLFQCHGTQTNSTCKVKPFSSSCIQAYHNAQYCFSNMQWNKHPTNKTKHPKESNWRPFTGNNMGMYHKKGCPKP